MILQNQNLDIIFVHFSLSQNSLGKIKTRNYIINGFAYLKTGMNFIYNDLNNMCTKREGNSGFFNFFLHGYFMCI